VRNGAYGCLFETNKVARFFGYPTICRRRRTARKELEKEKKKKRLEKGDSRCPLCRIRETSFFLILFLHVVALNQACRLCGIPLALLDFPLYAQDTLVYVP